MNKMKTLFFAAAFLIFGISAFAADATVTFVSGKVEVQRGSSWVAIKKGDSLSKSDMISTGFQSEAKIKILDSVMYLGPVTRITLEELSTANQTDNVNVYLKTGTTRSQVKHVDNKRVNYQVHTAVAVASCRGTDWIIDDSNNITGIDGMIAVSAFSLSDSAAGNMEDLPESLSSEDGVRLQAGQQVSVSETNTVSDPVNTIVTEVTDLIATVSTASDKESVGGVNVVSVTEAGASASEAPKTTSVVVTVEFPVE